MRRFLLITSTVAISFVLLSIALVWAFGDDPGATRVVRLSDIEPDEPHYIETRGVYIVRRGDRLVAVDERIVHHNESLGVDTLKDEAFYCARSGLFESRKHGSKFDWRGRYYGGPASRGLTTYPVDVEDGHVYIDLAHPRPGLPRSSPATEPVGPFCSPT
jgi:nitrite reductase/ring-hydroxylating ferredoxin subunit